LSTDWPDTLGAFRGGDNVAWAFAYGSLMGDALLGRFAARPARLDGFQRAFRHESTRRWGTPAHPCPILGLVPGGECWGLAFAVPEAERRAVERALAKREAAGERRRETLTAETEAGPIDTWVWVSRPSNDETGTDLDALEARLRAAHGVVGNGVEYVRTVVHAMERHGIRDPLVATLWARLLD
jgi:cation transport protein ChaC